MLDRDVVRRTLLTAMHGRVLYRISQAQKPLSAFELAGAVYGEDAVRGARKSLEASTCAALRALAKEQLISFHLRTRTACRGARAVAVWSLTQRGEVWLHYHPEAREPHIQRALPSRRKKSTAEAASVAKDDRASPAPLNLRKYTHRPLPLRVRKACGVPAHFWR